MHGGTQNLGTEPVNEARANSISEAEIDSGLVRDFVSGKESAFNQIVLRHRERIFSVSMALLKNRADAEEIVQDTFVRAFNGLKSFRGDSSLATWLHRIAINLSKNRYWYFWRRRRHSTISIDAQISDESDATFADMIENDSPTPELEVIVLEFEAILKRAMRHLSYKKREILELWIDEHMTYEQISEAYGIEGGTVKSRLARARADLVAIIAESYPELIYRDQLKEIFKVATRSSVLKVA